jgi:hypothetical protein
MPHNLGELIGQRIKQISDGTLDEINATYPGQE